MTQSHGSAEAPTKAGSRVAEESIGEWPHSLSLAFGIYRNERFYAAGPLLGARGETAVKLKILVFDPDLGLRELLKVYLAGKGHEVFAFSDATVCPLYRNLQDENCRCPLEKPCADAMLVDIHTPHINAIDLLELQRHRGCKALDENKAVMSASITKALETAVTAFGCHHIRKPFHLGDINSWIDGCKARLAARRQLSS